MSQASTSPGRIQRIRHVKGWRAPEDAVYVGWTGKHRGKWGNPFHNSYPKTPEGRAAAVAAYCRWLEETEEGRRTPEAARQELCGKPLMCWCPLDQPCHADVLLALANASQACLE